MNDKDLENYCKRIAELDLPIHLRELADKLHISQPTASKLLMVLEAQGRIKIKRMGKAKVVLNVEEKQSSEVESALG